MGDDKDTKWDLPIGGTAEKSLDESADDALKKVGEPMTTDLGTNFEHSKPASLNETDEDAVSADISFIDEQIKEDEKKDSASIDEIVSKPSLPTPPTGEPDADISFGSYGDKSADPNAFKDTAMKSDPFSEVEKVPEIIAETKGSLAELAEKSSAKKAELEETIKKTQAELDKIAEIETGIKELQAQEASLMEKANGLF
ncbi:MAG: hypothetical protein WCI57_03860 [Candidatus Berkelbacteria bacterium]